VQQEGTFTPFSNKREFRKRLLSRGSVAEETHDTHGGLLTASSEVTLWTAAGRGTKESSVKI
jgi:hypothetical protein